MTHHSLSFSLFFFYLLGIHLYPQWCHTVFMLLQLSALQIYWSPTMATKEQQNNKLNFLSAGRWDQGYWQEVRPAGVPVFPKNQSHSSSARELPNCRDWAVYQSEGLSLCFGQHYCSDGQSLLQHRAQCCIQVTHSCIVPNEQIIHVCIKLFHIHLLEKIYISINTLIE